VVIAVSNIVELAKEISVHPASRSSNLLLYLFDKLVEVFIFLDPSTLGAFLSHPFPPGVRSEAVFVVCSIVISAETKTLLSKVFAWEEKRDRDLSFSNLVLLLLNAQQPFFEAPSFVATSADLQLFKNDSRKCLSELIHKCIRVLKTEKTGEEQQIALSNAARILLQDLDVPLFIAMKPFIPSLRNG